MSLADDLNAIQRSKSLRDPSMSPSWDSLVHKPMTRKLKNEFGILNNGLEEMHCAAQGVNRSPIRTPALASYPFSREIENMTIGNNQKRIVEANTRARRRRKLLRCGYGDRRSRYKCLRREGKKEMNNEMWRSDSEVLKSSGRKDLQKHNRALHNGLHFLGRGSPHAYPSTCFEREIKSMISPPNSYYRKHGTEPNAGKDIMLFSHSSHKNEHKGTQIIQNHGSIVLPATQNTGYSPFCFPSKHQSDTKNNEKENGDEIVPKELKGSHIYIQQHEGELSEPSSVSRVSNSGSFVSSCNRDLQKHHMNGKNENFDVNDSFKHSCGLNWNWPRIQGKGKSIWDMAGRSLSCGLSDSALRKVEGLISNSFSSSQREYANALETSEPSTAFIGSDSESLPLLTEPAMSQGSADADTHCGKLSGELDLYNEYNSRARRHSHLSSVHKSKHHFGERGTFENVPRTIIGNQSLSQKYVPKTFNEIVGQNIVTQALMNAIPRGKLSRFYLFHGPHGTGKTSCARVFAAAMNCESLNARQPCQECDSCLNLVQCQSSDVKAVGRFDSSQFESFHNIFENIITYIPSSRYGVLILDNCDVLSSHDWKTFSKILDDLPCNIVFIFITSNLDFIPHNLKSRCQKFLFSKLKEIDIVKKVQYIALVEGMEVENDALSLIASIANGSMRDAEMMLDQLSLLGQKISLSLVQELVGLIPDEKLVDLLDLALSADTANTVRCIRELVESGAEPLSLMSQLATLITDILAGSYKLHKERHSRKFFQKQTLSTEEMSRLRKALKTLSEAKKQLLLTTDRTTWLIAAMLQLAPDQSHALRGYSSGSSSIQSPAKKTPLDQKFDQSSHGIIQDEHATLLVAESKAANVRGLHRPKFSREFGHKNAYVDRLPRNKKSSFLNVSRNATVNGMDHVINDTDDLPVYPSTTCSGMSKFHDMQLGHRSHETLSENYNLHVEGQINRIDGIDQLEGTAGENVIATISKDEKDDKGSQIHLSPNTQPSSPLCKSGNLCANMDVNAENIQTQHDTDYGSENLGAKMDVNAENIQTQHDTDYQKQDFALLQGTDTLCKKSPRQCLTEQPENNMSTFISKERVSIAEQIEEQNLRLEPQSGGLLCWKGSKVHKRKPLHLTNQERRSRLLRRFVLCGN